MKVRSKLKILALAALLASLRMLNQDRFLVAPTWSRIAKKVHGVSLVTRSQSDASSKNSAAYY